MRQAMILGRTNAHALMKAVVLGKVRVRVAAGETLRFAREDAQRLAAEAE
jgi:hypothetical protein